MWTTTAAAIGIEEVLTAPRSPWQNAYAERLIGSIRRECLDHIIVIGERGLRRALTAYVEYYLKSRTHLALNKDAPVSRSVATPADGEIVAIPLSCAKIWAAGFPPKLQQVRRIGVWPRSMFP